VRTVQGTLTDAFAEVLGERAKLLFASRTDAGVHASHNVAVARLEHLPFAAEKLADILNAKLPRDIAVAESREVPHGFHPRFYAGRRDYEYSIYRGQRPDVRLMRYCAHYAGALELPAMELAAQLFPGEHDFSEFCIKGELRNPRCTILRCEVRDRGKILAVRFSANRFLRRMVCFMVGALVDIGSGRIALTQLAEALKPGDHPNFTNMPGNGLTLTGVHYPERLYYEELDANAAGDAGTGDEDE
jgi:tRNA pseudouridine38-40 synthase